MKTDETLPSLRPVIAWSLAVCLVVAMAPWFTGGQEPIAMLVSSCALLLGVLLVWRQPAVRSLPSGPVMWTYAGLMSWAALSLFWTANRYSTVVWICTFLLAGLAFYLAYALAGFRRGRWQLVQGYLASATIMCGYGIWLYFSEAYDRFTSTFYWPNPAAAYLMPAIMLCLDGVRRSGRERWWWSAGLIIFGTCFALADSRAASLVLLIVVMVYVATQRLAKRDWIHYLFSLILIIGMTTGVAQLHSAGSGDVKLTTPGSRFVEVVAGQAQSGTDRVSYLRAAADMWFHHPLGGVGAGAYGDVHPQYQKEVTSASIDAHNFYVQVWAELSFVGLVLLTWLGLHLFIGSVRGGYNRQHMALTLGLLGLLMHAGLDIDMRYPAIALLIGALFGALYVSRRSIMMRPSWYPTALAALVLAPLISLHLSETWFQRGLVSQDESDFSLAAEQFGEAHRWLVYDPDTINAEGINLYSLALTEPDERQTYAALALDRARQAIRLDPVDAEHRQLEGRVLRVQGDLPGAERAFREALRLDPRNTPEYALDLATVLKRLERRAESLEVARQMLGQYPEAVIEKRSMYPQLRVTLADLWAFVGNTELENGNEQEARDAVTSALRIDRTNLQARFLQRRLPAGSQ